MYTLAPDASNIWTSPVNMMGKMVCDKNNVEFKKRPIGFQTPYFMEGDRLGQLTK